MFLERFLGAVARKLTEMKSIGPMFVAMMLSEDEFYSDLEPSSLELCILMVFEFSSQSHLKRIQALKNDLGDPLGLLGPPNKCPRLGCKPQLEDLNGYLDFENHFMFARNTPEETSFYHFCRHNAL